MDYDVMRVTACDVGNCDETATHEGWERERDFSGNTTGLRIRRRLCRHHAKQVADRDGLRLED